MPQDAKVGHKMPNATKCQMPQNAIHTNSGIIRLGFHMGSISPTFFVAKAKQLLRK
jgi:hypothetical protein